LVNYTKWIAIAAGLVGLGLFTQEAAATGLTGTLQRTGLAGGTIGTGIGSVGQGIGSFFSGALAPFWEIRNIIRGFMNLGSATPWLDDIPNQGGGTTENTGSGGGSESIPASIQQGVPDVYTGRGFSFYNDQVISPVPVADVQVTWTGGETVDLPLSVHAIKWYQDLGVEVTPNDGGGISELSGGGGGYAITNVSSPTTAGAGGTWGTNVSTPSGGVASGNLSLGGYA